MPTRKKRTSKAKSKKKTQKKKVMKRKVARKAAKRKPARAKKAAKKVVKAKKVSKAVRAKKAEAAKIKALGKVTHYYDRIGVAIVELKSPIRVGDVICLKRGALELVQQVGSLQINHVPVPQAKKGDVIGMKVDQEVQKGTLVIAA